MAHVTITGIRLVLLRHLWRTAELPPPRIRGLMHIVHIPNATDDRYRLVAVVEVAVRGKRTRRTGREKDTRIGVKFKAGAITEPQRTADPIMLLRARQFYDPPAGIDHCLNRGRIISDTVTMQNRCVRFSHAQCQYGGKRHQRHHGFHYHRSVHRIT